MAKKKVRSFHVTPADNGGYVCETDMDEKGGMGSYTPPSKTVHPNLNSVSKHMKSHIQDDGSPKNNKSSHSTLSKSIVQNAAKNR